MADKAPGVSARDYEITQRVIKDFEAAKRHHDRFVMFVDRMYRSYRGVLEKQSEAAQWTSKVHPGYAFDLIESVVANMIDDKTTFQMNPRPLLDDPQRAEEYITGSKALEYVIRYELEQDRFSAKQRPFALQNSIAGLSVFKVAWDYQEGPSTRYVPQDRELRHPETDEVIGTYPVLVEQEHTRVLRDGPNVEVVDIRDFFWPENAQDVQSAEYVIHRVWMSMEELKELEAAGVYQNVSKLHETRDIQTWEGQIWREDQLFLTNRKRNKVEVLEWWGPDGSVITVGNRRVPLRVLPANPFHHRQRPFIAASSQPQPFQFVGASDMELIEPLQRALWTSLNQTFDNVALLNNAIIILRDTADDQDYEFAPGEFWTVEDPTEVTMWQPNPLPAEIANGMQQRLQGDMNNVTGGMGISSATQSLDANTATATQTFASIAQKRLQARRAQFAYGYEDLGNQVISLCQQFIRDDRLVPMIGLGGAQSFERVSPYQIQGNYVCSVTSISESLMRQERRAEAQAMFTLALQAAPIAAAVGSPLNMKKFVEDLLEAFDKDDPETYFAQAAPQGPPGMPPGAPGGGAVGAPQIGDVPEGIGGPAGVTAPTAAGINSPSNALSQSPALMMQRALAQRGGGRSTPGS